MKYNKHTKYQQDFPELGQRTPSSRHKHTGPHHVAGFGSSQSKTRSTSDLEHSPETADTSPKQTPFHKSKPSSGKNQQPGSSKDAKPLRFRSKFDFSSRSKRVKKKHHKKQAKGEDIGYYQFKFLSQDSKLEAIKDLPTEKLKQFFSKEYLEKFLNRLNSDVQDKQRFVAEFSHSFALNISGDKIEVKTTSLKDLFNSPDFLAVCQRLTIDSLTARKEVKISTVNKMKSIMRKMAFREKCSQRPLYEANLRVNHPRVCHYSGHRSLTRNMY